MLLGPRFHSWPCGYSPALSTQGTATVSQEKRPSSKLKPSATCSGDCRGNRSEFGRMVVISTPFVRKAEREYVSQMQPRQRVLDPAARDRIKKNLCVLA